MKVKNINVGFDNHSSSAIASTVLKIWKKWNSAQEPYDAKIMKKQLIAFLEGEIFTLETSVNRLREQALEEAQIQEGKR